MTLTIEAPNGGDDRASAAPASRRNDEDTDNDADEARVDYTLVSQRDSFSASFGVIAPERDK